MPPNDWPLPGAVVIAALHRLAGQLRHAELVGRQRLQADPSAPTSPGRRSARRRARRARASDPRTAGRGRARCARSSRRPAAPKSCRPCRWSTPIRRAAGTRRRRSPRRRSRTPPSIRPSTNHLKPTGVSTSLRPSFFGDAVDDRAADDGLADRAVAAPLRTVARTDRRSPPPDNGSGSSARSSG